MSPRAQRNIHRRQLETLLETARRGGRDIESDPIQEPVLQREFGVMRFFKQTYGFLMRKTVRRCHAGAPPWPRRY